MMSEKSEEQLLPEGSVGSNAEPAMGTTTKEQRVLKGEFLKIALVVTLYWFVSITLIFVNKSLLSGSEHTLEAPLFITFFQGICSILMCLLIRFLSSIFPQWFSFPSIKIDLAISRKILPLSIMFVCMVTFNNLCLKYLGVAFYFVGRSLTTVCNVIFSYLLLGQKTSFPVMFSCGVIISGFWLGVDQENTSLESFSFWGVVFGVLASASVSLNSIYTKKLLPVVDENIWKLAYYNNINASFIFIILIVIFGEIPVLMSFDKFTDPTFISMMMVGGVFGFAIAYVTGLQIKVTSPLTHNISGTAKACFQTILACLWYSEIKSLLWWTSNVIVITGSMLYSYLRQREMTKKIHGTVSHKV